MSEQLTTTPRPVRISWELSNPASIEDTWAAFADTDRFNRAAGLGFWFEEFKEKDGSSRIVGHMRRLGMHITWDETPFQYRAPEWFRSVRALHNGPGRELVTSLRLKTDKNQTLIRYAIEVIPRNALSRLLVALELNLLTKPKVEKAIRDVLIQLAGKPRVADPRPPALPADVDRRVSDLAGRLQPAKLSASLAQFLRNAPLADQDRMMPLRLAKRWLVDDQEAIDGMLSAARDGLLAVRWEVMCPACRAPKQRLEKLEDLTTQVHCPSCNIQFDGAFPDAVEVSFRPSPAIRDFELHTACVGSPARQPHVVAQDRVEPGGELEVTLFFMPGPYKLRSRPRRESCSIEIREDAPPSSPTISIGLFSFSPARVVLPPGPQRIVLKNVTDRPIDLSLERHFRSPDILTAGHLLSMPEARALLPEGALIPGFEVESLRAGVVAVQVEWEAEAAIREVEQQLRELEPRRLVVRAGEVLATFLTFAEAMAAGRKLIANPRLRVAVNVGSLIEVQLAKSRVPMGTAVEEALDVLRTARPGELAIPEKAGGEREVKEVLEANRASLWPPGVYLPGAMRASWIAFEK